MVCSASATLLRLPGKETESFHKGGQMHSLSGAIFFLLWNKRKGILMVFPITKVTY